MATWTKMKINKLVQIEWADALKKFVVCHTVYGDLTGSVKQLKEKIQSPNLLPTIREIYQDMIEFSEFTDKNEKVEAIETDANTDATDRSLRVE